MVYYLPSEEWQSLIIFGLGTLYQLFHYGQYCDPSYFKKIHKLYHDTNNGHPGWIIIFYPPAWPYIWFAMNVASAAAIFLIFKQYDVNSDYWQTTISVWVCLTLFQKFTQHAFGCVSERSDTASNNAGIFSYPYVWLVSIMSLVTFALSVVIAVMAGLVWQDDNEQPGEAVAVALFSLVGLWQLYLFLGESTLMMKFNNIKLDLKMDAKGLKKKKVNSKSRGSDDESLFVTD